MTQPNNCKFHSTAQFRNVVKHFQDIAKFGGLDSEGKAIINPLGIAPTISYIGTTKLHGTNASIILEKDGTISFHSKNNLLGYVHNEEFTLLSDNAEFAQTMFRRFKLVQEIMEEAKIRTSLTKVGTRYPIKVSGEWVGSGIQKGVGISYLDKKSFFIFGIKNGATDATTKSGWLDIREISFLTPSKVMNDSGFYAITDFTTQEIDIDFQNPEYSQNTLVLATEYVEKLCPVSTSLGLKDSGGIEQTLGEGLVWTPLDSDLCWDSGTWFKTKGEKHSVSKTKSVAAIDPEKLESIKAFVEYAVTENRLQQGLAEVGSNCKLIGTFIGWINKDINKEEGDVLENSNLSMKVVGKYLTTKAREWYIKEISKV